MSLFPESLTIGLPGGILPPFSSVARTAQICEERGAEAIWFPDHLMGLWPQSLWTPDVTPLAARQPNPHRFLDPVVAMAASAAATSRLKLGVGVVPALGSHPAHLARAYLSLSHLSGGRVILGLGSGEAENLGPYGMAFKRPAARTIEALRIIRLLWESNEPISFEGEYWRLTDAVLGLETSDEASAPPIWLAAMGPLMLQAAGSYADGWLPVGLIEPDGYAAGWATIAGALRAAGRGEERFTRGLFMYTVVDERESEVERLLEAPLIKGLCLMHDAEMFHRHGVEHPLGADFNGWRDYIPTRVDRETALKALDRVPPAVVRDMVAAGTPDQLADRLRRLQAAGLQHAVLWNVTPFADASLVRSSFELLAGLPFGRKR